MGINPVIVVLENKQNKYWVGTLKRCQTVTTHSYLTVSLLELYTSTRIQPSHEILTEYVIREKLRARIRNIDSTINQKHCPVQHWYQNADIGSFDTLRYQSRWFLISDHPNYTRFTTVHLVDLWNLKQKMDQFIDYCKKVHSHQTEQITDSQTHIV